MADELGRCEDVGPRPWALSDLLGIPGSHSGVLVQQDAGIVRKIRDDLSFRDASVCVAISDCS